MIPVVLVAYNRPKHTRAVLDALRVNLPEKLFVFCDGPKGEGDTEAVTATREVIAGIDWVETEIIERERNIGLAHSIVGAVDHVLARHGEMILLEDDCVPGPHFLEFMTCALNWYRDSWVLGVTGYTVPIPPEVRMTYPWDVYFTNRIGSWGWGTWRSRWKLYERDLSKAVGRLRWQGIDPACAGRDMAGYIARVVSGELDAWTPGWQSAALLNDMPFVYPTVSHISNIGFDGSGAHCTVTNRYETPIAETCPVRFPTPVSHDMIGAGAIERCFRRYYP